MGRWLESRSGHVTSYAVNLVSLKGYRKHGRYQTSSLQASDLQRLQDVGKRIKNQQLENSIILQ